MCVGIVIVTFFMTFMLPRFLSIFQGFKVPLPAATQLLVSISNAFRDYWWLMILLAIALFIVLTRYRATAAGKRSIDQWKMKAPILGKVVRLNLFAEFARTLS